jgi:hypothetical protein
LKILIIGILLLFSSGLFIQDGFSASSLLSPNTQDEIVIEKTLDVNLILIGDKWTSANSKEIRKNLTLEYEPITLFGEQKIGIHYNYNYNFLSVSEEDSDKLFDIMSKNAGIGDQSNLLFHHTVWTILYHPEWLDDNGTLTIPYESYDVLDMEQYLYDKIIKNDPNLNSSNSVNLIFLKGDLSKLNSIHDYTLTSRDTSSNKSFDAFGLTGYGGNYNFYFFDLYASPWMDFDFDYYFETGDIDESWYIPTSMLGLHDCINYSCFTDIVQGHTNNAIQHIVNPSTVYPIDYKNNYLIDIVVYSMPGASNITRNTVDKFIDSEKIIREIESLIPFSKISVNLSTENHKSSGMSLDFKHAISNSDHIIESDPWNDSETNYTLLRSEQIKPYLLEWAKERQSLTQENFDWVIPVLISVDSSPHRTFLDSWGVTGFAPPMDWDDGSLQACCAFGVLESDDVWSGGVGGTDLVLHEVGHTLGLAHPFQSVSPNSYVFSDNSFWNQYASPMTYAGPPNGCGYVFSLVYTNLCGIANSSFTEFERKHMANMIFTSLVKNTKDNLTTYKEFESYEFKKYNEVNQTITEILEKFQKIDILSENSPLKDIQQSYIQSHILINEIPLTIVERTEKENPFGKIYLDSTSMVYSKYDTQFLKISGDVNKKLLGPSHVIISIKAPNGDIDYLNVGLSKTKHFESLYVIDQEFQVGKYKISVEYGDETSNIKYFEITKFEKKSSEPPAQIISTPSEIPSWIKNNAKWWADGSIDDNSFTQGLQYLINEKIMNVESKSQKSGESKEIPSWIKNNAKWWADGSIDEKSFISGIEYLVKEGIISVN